MAAPGFEDCVLDALEPIENARLSHPSGPLLSRFVTEALSPALAAKIILGMCHGGFDQKGNLLSLVSDWAYIVESCYLWDPLVVVPILPVPFGLADPELRISNMLGAFFTPPYRDWCLHNEFNALQMVRRYTPVPVPRPLDIVSQPARSNNNFYNQDVYLLTTRIPGITLSKSRETPSDDDAIEFVAQLQPHLTQLRAIPKTVSPEHAICNTLGGSCTDTRIRDGNPVGPFVDEASFSQLLRNPYEPSRSGHSIAFTHADLNARNILVDRVTRSDGTRGWRLMGTVNWEFSGYYLEYWEYTKSLFEGFRYTKRWQNVFHETFPAFGDLSKEFVEKRSWEEGDYV
ncbi:hypothetical protein PG984_001055 [Apiospora sp. TS-2023a]